VSGPARSNKSRLIHLEARYLPQYALFSLSRGVMAYGISFAFTMVYGYAMARVAGAERVMLRSSIFFKVFPVLGFLRDSCLDWFTCFQIKHRLGNRLGADDFPRARLWNMDVSFYSSLKSCAAGFTSGGSPDQNVLVGTVSSDWIFRLPRTGYFGTA